MTKHTDEGLVTDDPQIAAMFLGKDIDVRNANHTGWLFLEPMALIGQEEWRIPYPLVWQAIQPVEGEGYIPDCPAYSLNDDLQVRKNYHTHIIGDPDCWHKRIHKRILNIITTRIELRELVKRCKGGRR